jgi:hypothetical protein
MKKPYIKKGTIKFGMVKAVDVKNDEYATKTQK